MYESLILTDVCLRDYSTLRIGGIARKIVVAQDINQICEVYKSEPLIILGRGSNVLFSDLGVEQKILLLQNADISIEGCDVVAGAGASLPSLAKKCAAAGLAGAEWMCGIPASVGGAVCMNAGAHGSSISEILIGCGVALGNNVVELSSDQCEFGYRDSAFRHGKGIVVWAKFRLTPLDKGQIEQKMKQNLAFRRRAQPSEPSLGSVFRNADKPAGFYIDQAGLKGLRVGDVMVSQKHANFIVNIGQGTATDFLLLVERIKTRVYDRFGVELEEEFVRVGRF